MVCDVKKKNYKWDGWIISCIIPSVPTRVEAGIIRRACMPRVLRINVISITKTNFFLTLLCDLTRKYYRRDAL